jgi:protein SCO1/2
MVERAGCLSAAGLLNLRLQSGRLWDNIENVTLPDMRKMLSAFLFVFLFMVPLTVNAVSSKSTAVNVSILDLELLDQDGKRGRFKTDIIGDKLVALTFTYTTCTTICPILDAIFVDVQDRLGKRLGRDVALITMSIDPANDIPPRLKQYQKRLGAKPGWLFLTGKKPDVDRVLKGLDVYSPDIYSHPPAVFIGDGRRGIWRRLYGFPSPEQIMAVLKELEDGRR